MASDDNQHIPIQYAYEQIILNETNGQSYVSLDEYFLVLSRIQNIEVRNEFFTNQIALYKNIEAKILNILRIDVDTIHNKERIRQDIINILYEFKELFRLISTTKRGGDYTDFISANNGTSNQSVIHYNIAYPRVLSVNNTLQVSIHDALAKFKDIINKIGVSYDNKILKEVGAKTATPQQKGSVKTLNAQIAKASVNGFIFLIDHNDASKTIEKIKFCVNTVIKSLYATLEQIYNFMNKVTKSRHSPTEVTGVDGRSVEVAGEGGGPVEVAGEDGGPVEVAGVEGRPLEVAGEGGGPVTTTQTNPDALLNDDQYRLLIKNYIAELSRIQRSVSYTDLMKNNEIGGKIQMVFSETISELTRIINNPVLKRIPNLKHFITNFITRIFSIISSTNSYTQDEIIGFYHGLFDGFAMLQASSKIGIVRPAVNIDDSASVSSDPINTAVELTKKEMEAKGNVKGRVGTNESRSQRLRKKTVKIVAVGDTAYEVPIEPVINSLPLKNQKPGEIKQLSLDSIIQVLTKPKYLYILNQKIVPLIKKLSPNHPFLSLSITGGYAWVDMIESILNNVYNRLIVYIRSLTQTYYTATGILTNPGLNYGLIINLIKQLFTITDKLPPDFKDVSDYITLNILKPYIHDIAKLFDLVNEEELKGEYLNFITESTPELLEFNQIMTESTENHNLKVNKYKELFNKAMYKYHEYLQGNPKSLIDTIGLLRSL